MIRRRGRSGGGEAAAASAVEVSNRSDVPEEKSRRPKDTPFRQQRVKAWLPILQPKLVVGIFVAIGVVFIPLGNWFMDESYMVVEYKMRYDGDDVDVEGCEITEANMGTKCSFEIEIEEDMSPPIYVYYELGNYYQNHRRYVQSRSSYQLLGELIEADEEYCDPMDTVEVDGKTLDLNPCGLIANSMFNDTIKLDTSSTSAPDKIFMSEKDISWKSDREKRFKQPPGFVFAEVGTEQCPTLETACSECLSGDDSPYVGCKIHNDTEKGTSYKYWYRKDDEVQYLYEIYPDIVSPIEGVLNEHFIVWMRTAGLPRFRKLYGRIDEALTTGDILRFNITANFNVAVFDGEKILVVSNMSLMGAKNPYLGIAYIALGSLSLAIGVAFAIKHYSNPRRLGDTRFLVWKDTAL